jgi:hypothetical protein
MDHSTALAAITTILYLADHHRQINGLPMHTATGDGLPHVTIGTGDTFGSIRADCDPPGLDDNRPMCWVGPDRYTLEEAKADAEAHAPGVEPEVLDVSWPIENPWPLLDSPDEDPAQ